MTPGRWLRMQVFSTLLCPLDPAGSASGDAHQCLFLLWSDNNLFAESQEGMETN